MRDRCVSVCEVVCNRCVFVCDWCERCAGCVCVVWMLWECEEMCIPFELMDRYQPPETH